MPKLRRLHGKAVLKILQDWGFEIIAIKGSHHRLRRVVGGQEQSLSVAVHGSKPLKPGTLKSIYRQLSQYVSENELHDLFYVN